MGAALVAEGSANSEGAPKFGKVKHVNGVPRPPSEDQTVEGRGRFRIPVSRLHPSCPRRGSNTSHSQKQEQEGVYREE